MSALHTFLAAALLLIGAACSPLPGACPTSGTGSIALTFSGLPAGAEGKVTLTGAGPQTVSMPGTVTVGAGHWEVAGELAVVTDPLVRTVYAARASAPVFCLAKDATQAVEVTWSKVATSNRLWVGNGAGGSGNLQGFDSASLRATGAATASWSADAVASRAVAFDKAGNLWAIGNTTSDPLLARFPAEAFATAARPTADRALSLPGLSCVPALKAIAFDREGNLFAGSACKREVYKLPSASLAAAGPVTPTLTLTGVMGLEGLAFDKDGNLWVSDSASDELLRFDASALAGSAASPARRVKVRRTDQPADTSTLKPDALAFDKDGNLWSVDFGANVLFAVRAADLAGAGAQPATPMVRVSLSVSAVIEGLAFDEGGGLWLPWSAGRLARLSAAQLTVSTGSGAPTEPETVITGGGLGSAQGPALFPAPAGLPLFHALP